MLKRRQFITATSAALTALSLPVREAMDAGTAGALLDNQPAVAEIYTQAAFQIVLAVADKGRDFSSKFPKIVIES